MSGGLDSVCAFYALGKPPSVHYGGRRGPARTAAEGEMQALHRIASLDPVFAKRVRIVEFDFTPFMRPGRYILPRDQICLMLAHAQGFDSMAIAWTLEDGGDPGELHNMQQKLEHAVNNDAFKVKFPFAHTAKAQLIDKALAAGATREIILASHSCVRSSQTHCGTCENCLHRHRAVRDSKLGALTRQRGYDAHVS